MANDTVGSLFEDWKWTAPAGWMKITSIDTHTGGEPLRIITSGIRLPKGPVLAKRRYFMDNLDHVRTGLLREPRGHADMYGAVVTAADDDADLDVFFLNTVGYSPMCGHAILAIAKVVLETGLISKPGDDPEIVINVPPGRNYAKASVVDGHITQTSFKNVPSFVALQDQTIHVDGVGEIEFDLAFGGAFYAIVDAGALRLELTTDNYNALIDLGRRIKRAIVNGVEIAHPFEPEMSSLFGVIFTGAPRDPRHHSRNVTIFEDGEVDRSATGTGVSARAALHHLRGDLRIGHSMTIESIVDSTMTVKPVEAVQFGAYPAVIPEVAGEAHIMGRSEFYFAPADPFRSGFMIR